jgi:hypothetical protein
MEDAKGRIQDFASAASRAYPHDTALQLAYSKASRATRRTFEDPDYVDLASFLDRLLENYDEGSPLGQKARGLADWLRRRDGNGPVIHNAATGDYGGKAHGISIYLAPDQPSPLYSDLDFAQAGWLALLNAVYESV